MKLIHIRSIKTMIGRIVGQVNTYILTKGTVLVGKQVKLLHIGSFIGQNIG